MATQYSTAFAQPAPYHHHAYRKSAQVQYSPTASAMPAPINVSPTSPRNTQVPVHPQQQQQHMGIRPLKTAIGVPAALRRTERPVRQSPPNADSTVASPNSGWAVGNPFGQLSTDGMPSPVSRIGNEDMHSIYNNEPISPTAGPITRNHWQADSSTTVCSASACQAPFGLFNRRHHCRKCGGVFCWQHSSKQVRLDELARFHPEGELHRACDRCHSSFREWEHLRSSRTNSESSNSSAAAVQVETPAMPKRPENLRVGSLAQSFQGAWNWSTF